MIQSKDRSGYFGASDVSYIIGNRKTKSWLDWWLVKMGIARNNFENAAMNAGTHWEHRILDYISPEMEKDKQIIIEDLCLRINLDGNIGKEIHEIKTHRSDKPFKMPKKYIQQVNVQMFGYETRTAFINTYALTQDDYLNYFNDIDPERLKSYKIEYDKNFINNVFLPNISELSKALKKGILPKGV